MKNLRDIKLPESHINPSFGRITNGPLLSPKKIISTYSAGEYEDFTEEWAYDVLQKKYKKVRRTGGAGDYGLDIVADLKEGNGWDNYQCKHYDHALAPSDVWVEIGKIIYYSYLGQITFPNDYYFVAPHGVGTKLGRLLKDPVMLKAGLIENWKKHCLNKITSTGEVPLDDEFKVYIDTLDFSVFKDISPLEMIEQFKQSSRYALRFGGGLPERKRRTSPPFEEEKVQLFIQRLLEAYSEHSGKKIDSLEEVGKDKGYLEHLKQQRECYYSAEFLKEFARDSLPAEVAVFTDFQDEIFHGIIDELNLSTSDGYTNVQHATATASKLPILSNTLRDYISVIDRKGACHQLANEGRVEWVKPNGK